MMYWTLLILSLALLLALGIRNMYAQAKGQDRGLQDNSGRTLRSPKEQRKYEDDLLRSAGEILDDQPKDPVAPGEVWVEPITGMEFVWVPSGRFAMGQAVSEMLPVLNALGSKALYDKSFKDAQPLHLVRVSGFWMARHPVTIGQFRTFLKRSGSGQLDRENHCPLKPGPKGVLRGMESTEPKADDHPITCVSWHTARLMAIWMSSLGSGAFSLPTEAQWEYAARGGGKDRIYSGGDFLDPYGWHAGNSNGSLKPVARKEPNSLGLCDMCGNLGEWCRDWHGPAYYQSSPEINPMGPDNGNLRIVRGGNYQLHEVQCRCDGRDAQNPDKSLFTTGFRLVART